MGVFLRFLNYENSSKPRNASHILYEPIHSFLFFCAVVYYYY